MWNKVSVMSDYYQILGVSPSASQKEITAVYHAKCKLIHPDINPGSDSTIQMQLVNEAYRVLKDEKLRHKYDIRHGIRRTPPKATVVKAPSCAAPSSYHSDSYKTSDRNYEEIIESIITEAAKNVKVREPLITFGEYWRRNGRESQMILDQILHKV